MLPNEVPHRDRVGIVSFASRLKLADWRTGELVDISHLAPCSLTFDDNDCGYICNTHHDAPATPGAVPVANLFQFAFVLKDGEHYVMDRKAISEMKIEKTRQMFKVKALQFPLLLEGIADRHAQYQGEAYLYVAPPKGEREDMCVYWVLKWVCSCLGTLLRRNFIGDSISLWETKVHNLLVHVDEANRGEDHFIYSLRSRVRRCGSGDNFDAAEFLDVAESDFACSTVALVILVALWGRDGTKVRGVSDSLFKPLSL